VRDHPHVARRAQAVPAEIVLQTLRYSDIPESLAGSYSVRVAKGVGRRSVSTSISVRRPRELDLVVLDPAGGIKAFIRSDGSELGVYAADEGILYRGPVDRAGSDVLGLGVSIEEFTGILVGLGIEPSKLREGASSWDARHQRVRVDHGPDVRAWIHPLSRRVDRVEYYGSRAHVVVDIGEWTEQTPPIPSRIRFSVESDSYSVELTLMGRALTDPVFPAAYFRLIVPPGTRELPLSGLGRWHGLDPADVPSS